MKIKEIRENDKNIALEAEVIEIGPVREFSKFGRPGKVASAIIKDDTGQVQLTLWDDQIEMFQVGDKVRLGNGYVKAWQGQLQVNVSRNGVLEKI